MQHQHLLWVSALAGAVVLALALPALAQKIPASTITGPDYSSSLSVGGLSDSNYNTPESEGRPGVKFFNLGSEAFRAGDYAHAVDMFKVASSWAYKPAEYDLGLMYFNGHGVPVNKSLGAAWMVLAAERGTPQYVKACDLMVTALSNAQFAETDKLWAQLKQTYGDKVALQRAKAQWAFVKNQQTGSHMGHATGELRAGVYDTGRVPPKTPASVISFAPQLTQSGSVDGSIAYRQFQQSDNPYSPIFLKHRSGSVKVEPLQQIKPGKAKTKPAATEPGGTHPEDM